MGLKEKSEKFRKETAAFIVKMLQSKKVIDENGNPVDDLTVSEPLVDLDGRSVILTTGETVGE